LAPGKHLENRRKTEENSELTARPTLLFIPAPFTTIATFLYLTKVNTELRNSVPSKCTKLTSLAIACANTPFKAMGNISFSTTTLEDFYQTPKTVISFCK